MARRVQLALVKNGNQVQNSLLIPLNSFIELLAPNGWCSFTL